MAYNPVAHDIAAAAARSAGAQCAVGLTGSARTEQPQLQALHNGLEVSCRLDWAPYPVRPVPSITTVGFFYRRYRALHSSGRRRAARSSAALPGHGWQLGPVRRLDRFSSSAAGCVRRTPPPQPERRPSLSLPAVLLPLASPSLPAKPVSDKPATPATGLYAIWVFYYYITSHASGCRPFTGLNLSKARTGLHLH